MKTQEEKVIEKLNLDGFVSNFWAINEYILRLGSVINNLKNKGWVFRTEWGEGQERKNYYYYLVKKPDPVQGRLTLN
jgi:helix-turn-helix protein